MLSYAIDNFLGQVGCEPIEGSLRVINFSEYLFRQTLVSPVSNEDAMALRHLFVEYAVFESTGESGLHNLVEDATMQHINISDTLDAESVVSQNALEEVLGPLASAIDREFSLQVGDKRMFPVITKWVYGLGNPIAEVMLFVETE